PASKTQPINDSLSRLAGCETERCDGLQMWGLTDIELVGVVCVQVLVVAARLDDNRVGPRFGEGVNDQRVEVEEVVGKSEAVAAGVQKNQGGIERIAESLGTQIEHPGLAFLGVEAIEVEIARCVQLSINGHRCGNFLLLLERVIGFVLENMRKVSDP